MQLKNNALFILACLFIGLRAEAFIVGDVVDDTIQAILIDDAAGVQKGLRRGLDPNYLDADGDTLLMTAARVGATQSAAVLINAGARVHGFNVNGDSALLFAALGGHAQIVDMLLARGASLGANKHGWTPLGYAAFNGHVGIVRKLIAHGANIDAATQSKLTPLMVAAMNGHIEVVRALLAAGALTSPVNQDGKTARDLALERGNTDIAALIDAARRPGTNPAPVPPQQATPAGKR